MVTKKKYNIQGMHCVSCASIINKKLREIPGVHNADVNFATENVQIDFDQDKVNIEKMNNEIGKLGYKISTHENTAGMDAKSMNMTEDEHAEHLGLKMSKEQKLKDLLDQELKMKFVMPIALTVFALMIWDILSKTFPGIPAMPITADIWNGVLFIISTIVLFWVGKPFILGVIRFARYHVANMDSLVGIGTLTAYSYSMVITLFPKIRQVIELPGDTYFDVVVVVIAFVAFGKYLEARSRIRTGEAIEKLLNLQAKTALVFREGMEVEIPISEVLVGDIVIIKPGMKIPVDGKIIEGNSSIDESMITGEPIPADKVVGDFVIGSTINKQGGFKFEATKVGANTLLSQIIRMVMDAQGSKAPIQALADKISAVFVPVVLLVAILALSAWLIIGIPILGQSVAISYGILSFVGILIIACPCALGLATPTAIIVGVGKGAEYGILIKDAESLELLSKVDTVVLDKTGTITKGKPEVVDVVSLGSLSENEILKISGSVEKMSEHPLAEAIVTYVINKNIPIVPVKEFIALSGMGVKAILENKNIYIHRPEKGENDPRIKKFEGEGKTVVIVEVDNNKIGLIALSDTVKDGARDAINKLHNKGIKVIMLTGDNRLAAEYIAKQVGIDSVIAEVLPNEKADKIKELQKEGKVVAMAGDGINDAPALVQANVGIAMATGTDIAIESAGITLIHGDIHKISQAIELSRATIRTVRQNLFWAFIYNVVGIPVAAGALYPIWGIVLNPVFAGLAMAGSSVSVVFNSLRLKVKKLK